MGGNTSDCAGFFCVRRTYGGDIALSVAVVMMPNLAPVRSFSELCVIVPDAMSYLVDLISLSTLRE